MTQSSPKPLPITGLEADMLSREDRDYARTTQFPSPILDKPSAMDDQEKIEYIATRFQEIMEVLGLDLSDESLAKTPTRVAKMYVHEIFSGLDRNTFPPLTFIKDKYSLEEAGNRVFMKVNFCSFCEHHFVPIKGIAYVAYLPNKKLIGLSKIPRIVRYFSKRPQVQERLTAQIADCLSFILETEDVAVYIAAEHYCIVARGIEDDDSHAITHVLKGRFLTDTHTRKEFFDAVNKS